MTIHQSFSRSSSALRLLRLGALLWALCTVVPSAADAQDSVAVVIANDARLRTEASISAATVTSLARGSRVLVTMSGPTWSFVEFGDRRGYIRTVQLEMVRSPERRVDVAESLPREAPLPSPQVSAPALGGWTVRVEVSGVQRTTGEAGAFGSADLSQDAGVRFGENGVGFDGQVRLSGRTLSVGIGYHRSTHGAAQLGTASLQRVTWSGPFVEPRLSYALNKGNDLFATTRVQWHHAQFSAPPDSATAVRFGRTARGRTISLGAGLVHNLTPTFALVAAGSVGVILTDLQQLSSTGTADASSPTSPARFAASEAMIRLGISVRY